jgi:Polysaccharide deacetylase
MIRANLKRAFLTACASLGCFALARRITRTQLRILCYHGFSIGDQHLFSPLLYMRPETFQRQLDLIVRMGFPVVSLNEGLAMLRSNTVRRGETVITIDDGWKTTTLAAERLRKAALPACLYVTTYYVGKPVAVFNVVVRYMLWRCAGQVIDVRGVHPRIDGTVDLRSPYEAMIERWIAFADAELNWQQRQQLLGKLAAALCLDIDEVLADGRFASLDERQIAEIADYGIDVQLHTHRHRFSPTDFGEVKREIEDNRAVLEPIMAAQCDHFCFPSGLYAQNHPTWLSGLGVVSATTCEPGLNDARTDPYLLRRYLARDDAPDIELASELSGFSEILRRCRARLRSIVGLSEMVPAPSAFAREGARVTDAA